MDQLSKNKTFNGKVILNTVYLLSIVMIVALIGSILYYQSSLIKKTPSTNTNETTVPDQVRGIDQYFTDKDKEKIARVTKIDDALGTYHSVLMVYPQDINELSKDSSAMWYVNPDDITIAQDDFIYCVSADTRDYEIDVSLEDKGSELMKTDNQDAMNGTEGDNPDRYELGSRLDLCKN